MAGSPVAVASAVILPEIQATLQPPSPTLKRRRDSTPSPHSKRARLSQDRTGQDQDGTSSRPTASSREDRMNERRKNGPQEERKRGQRLFGALLGTLSQSSSSTAAKRRADIESKQRTKLQQRNEEEDEKRKAKLEAINVLRRKEQKIFDRQSMRLRHSNTLAQAHFLQTKAEPRLYYKPWELLPDEDAKIKEQIQEAKDVIDRELREFDGDHDPTTADDMEKTNHQETPSKDDTKESVVENDGKEIDTDNFKEAKANGTNHDDLAMPDTEPPREDQSEANKDTGEDGGEMVEGDEDTVIY